MKSTKRTEETRYVVLRKLAEIGKPMSLLEMGFTATPQAVRNMAARGMVRVTVEMTERGRQVMDAETARRKRRDVNASKDARKTVGGL